MENFLNKAKGTYRFSVDVKYSFAGFTHIRTIIDLSVYCEYLSEDTHLVFDLNDPVTLVPLCNTMRDDNRILLLSERQAFLYGMLSIARKRELSELWYLLIDSCIDGDERVSLDIVSDYMNKLMSIPFIEESTYMPLMYYAGQCFANDLINNDSELKFFYSSLKEVRSKICLDVLEQISKGVCNE